MNYIELLLFNNIPVLDVVFFQFSILFLGGPMMSNGSWWVDHGGHYEFLYAKYREQERNRTNCTSRSKLDKQIGLDCGWT